MSGGANTLDRPVAWSLLGSLLAHVLFAAAAVALFAVSPPATIVPEALQVEILTPQQLAVFLSPNQLETPSVTAPEPPPVETEPPPRPPDTPGMIRPSTLLSAGVLANPANAQARAALPRLAAPERMEQLCNIEAMEQIHAWREHLSPDRLVAYAMVETEFEGHTVVAEGGAIRIDHRWYDIVYHCSLSPDHGSVLDFEFLLGDAIPESEWEAHNLPALY